MIVTFLALCLNLIASIGFGFTFKFWIKRESKHVTGQKVAKQQRHENLVYYLCVCVCVSVCGGTERKWNRLGLYVTLWFASASWSSHYVPLFLWFLLLRIDEWIGWRECCRRDLPSCVGTVGISRGYARVDSPIQLQLSEAGLQNSALMFWRNGNLKPVDVPAHHRRRLERWIGKNCDNNFHTGFSRSLGDEIVCKCYYARWIRLTMVTHGFTIGNLVMWLAVVSL